MNARAVRTKAVLLALLSLTGIGLLGMGAYSADQPVITVRLSQALIEAFPIPLGELGAGGPSVDAVKDGFFVPYDGEGRIEYRLDFMLISDGRVRHELTRPQVARKGDNQVTERLLTAHLTGFVGFAVAREVWSHEDCCDVFRPDPAEYGVGTHFAEALYEAGGPFIPAALEDQLLGISERGPVALYVPVPVEDARGEVLANPLLLALKGTVDEGWVEVEAGV